MTQRLFWDLSYYNSAVTAGERERAFKILNERYGENLKFSNEYINCEYLVALFNGVGLYYASGDKDSIFGARYMTNLLFNLYHSDYIQRPIEELLEDNQQLGEL